MQTEIEEKTCPNCGAHGDDISGEIDGNVCMVCDLHFDDQGDMWWNEED